MAPADAVDHVEIVEIVRGVTEGVMPAKGRKETLLVDSHRPLEVKEGALEGAEVSDLLAKQGCELVRGERNTGSFIMHGWPQTAESLTNDFSVPGRMSPQTALIKSHVSLHQCF